MDCVVGLTADPTKDEIAYVVVSSASSQASAAAAFSAGGADLAKVEFIVIPTDSIWLRDYGPHFIKQAGARSIVDSHYYPSRPRDNFAPTMLAEDYFEIPSHHMGLYYSGGNFQPGPSRSGFVTSLVNQDNPGFAATTIEELYQRYQGIDTLHMFPRLPGSVDGTGHIDMWLYIVDPTNVIISQFKPGSNATAMQITEDAVVYMQGLGFTVHRTPAWNVGYTHYTYTNAFRTNDRIFTITYGTTNSAYLDEDAAAEAAWQTAAGPSVGLMPIDCYSIIPASGAIHCIVMQVPRHTAGMPSAHLIDPVGGEHLVTGTTREILWTADDDTGIATVDLYYSEDGGLSFPNVIATGLPNNCRYDWTVPLELCEDVVVKAVATDLDLNTVEAVNPVPLELSHDPMTVYDFSSGAGVDRWGWGVSTSNWSGSVDGNRYPVVEPLQPWQYTALSSSDATGGDGDTNRLISFSPGSARESTHVFEFMIAEDVAWIEDIEFRWEGYGDQCVQQELYVWNNLLGNWGDGAGKVGENAYLANYAGNRDDELFASIRSNFADYIDGSGRLTLMVYGERSGQKSFHDYLSVNVTYRVCQTDLGYGGPGLSRLTMCGQEFGSGNFADLRLVGAPPEMPTWVIGGPADDPAPFVSGLLVPNPVDLVLFAGKAKQGEILRLNLTGGGGPALYTIQFLVFDPAQPDGFGLSNAVEVQFLP